MIDSLKMLTLTFSGVFIEVLCCVWSLNSGLPLWATPTILALYHMGYVSVSLGWFSKYFSIIRISFMIGMLGLALGFYLMNWVLIAICVFIASSSLQMARRNQKSKVKIRSITKNVAKTIGMVSAIIGVLPSSILTLLLITISITTAMAISNEKQNHHNQQPSTGIRNVKLLLFEFFHHSHYFAYCYTFWALLSPILLLSVGPLFVIGWIGYYVLEWLLRERLRLYDQRVLILGHLVCSVALGAMLLFRTDVVIIILWFITGISGGTAYMLNNTINFGNRELHEDLGHVAGCLIATGAVMLTGLSETTVLCGATLALLAAIILMSNRNPVCSLNTIN